MADRMRSKNAASFWAALLLALGLGWLLYQFVLVGAVSLDAAPPPRPQVVARADWGARTPNLYAPEELGLFDPQTNPGGVLYYPSDLRDALNTIVIHHSAFSHASPAEIQAMQMDGRGFADIAYHFLIDSDGIIYEGRDIHIRGAHVQGFNTGAVGIVLIGNFSETEPSRAQTESLRSLVDYLRYTYGIRYLAGHRDYPDQSPDGTECPGDNLYPLLPDLAGTLAMKYGIGGYVRPEWVE